MPTTIHISLHALKTFHTEIYCAVAALALLVYDWLLCLDQEVRFIWSWRSRGVNVSSLVYALSRYALLIVTLLGVASTYPMSDLSCKANVWTQIAVEMLSLIALSTFSALRAYALSNRSVWMASIIIALALPPVAMRTVKIAFEAPKNLPSPLNCSDSSTLSPKLILSVFVIGRGSQLAAEILVIGITWWYTYQSYRIQKSIKLGRTISSLLFYNGSMYFLCIAAMYVLDIIFNSPLLPVKILDAGAFLDIFIDPIMSILTCRFMLSLRQFDSTIQSATRSGLDPQLHEHMASTVLQFGAQPSHSLPDFIASFAHPVHVDAVLSETDFHAIDQGHGVSGWQEPDAVAPIPAEALSRQRAACDQTSSLEPWV